MKTKQLLLTALALTLSLAGANAQTWTTNTLPPGLASWWQAEGGFLDSAGSNHGAPVGGVAFSPGRSGQGFVFNGTNQGVIVPHHASLDVPPTGFTVEFWMKAGKDQVEAISSVVDKDHSAQDNTGWEVSCWRDTGRLSFGIGDGTSFPLCTNLTDVLDNQFHHIAFAWEMTNWLIYVNGVLENSLYRPVTANSTRPLRFGYHWGDGTGTPMRFLKGSLDEVRLYSRALTATEVARLALNLPGANGIWGLKTHDPVSEPPTTLFWLDDSGANPRQLANVTLAGQTIEADDLAMSPNGVLFAFQINAPGGSRLLTLDSTSGIATAVGPVLSGRNIRGATFTLSGRLIAFDYTASELVTVDPTTGVIAGLGVPVAGLSPTSTGQGADLTQTRDGSFLFAYANEIHQLDPRSGARTLLFTDTGRFADNLLPWNAGVACSPVAVPDETIFAFEVSEDDSVYSYLPAAGFARTLLINDVVPAYNAGRGDLAALPAARVELLNFTVTGTNATLQTVCRGGAWAEVVSTDDLGVPNWQVVPGTAGWVPYTPGTIATPMNWTNLPANVPHRFFHARVQ